METIARVRREQARGKSIRAIARDLRLSRDTVAKYLRSGETEAKYERHCQPYPQLGPFLADLEELLGDNARSLGGIGWISGSYSRRFGGPAMPAAMTRCAVYARRWADIRTTKTEAKASEAFIPLTFAPAEAYQFDWSEEWIILDGIAFKAQVAHARLCHSRMPYIRAYPRQSQEMSCSTPMPGPLLSGAAPASAASTTT